MWFTLLTCQFTPFLTCNFFSWFVCPSAFCPMTRWGCDPDDFYGLFWGWPMVRMVRMLRPSPAFSISRVRIPAASNTKQGIEAGLGHIYIYGWLRINIRKTEWEKRWDVHNIGKTFYQHGWRREKKVVGLVVLSSIKLQFFVLRKKNQF